MDTQNQDEVAPDSGAEKSQFGRWGAGLLLVAALLVAGVFVWRTLNDSSDPDLVTQAGEPNAQALLELAQADPENPERWLEAGYAFFEESDFASAAKYYERATQTAPDSAIAWASYGEALAQQAEAERMAATDPAEASEVDLLPEPAIAAFKKALELDPTDPRSRYFLAIAKDLEGNKKAAAGNTSGAMAEHKAAVDDLLALLEDTPPGAPWEESVQQTIAQIGKINNIAVDDRIKKALAGRSPITSGPQLTAGDAIPGPTQEQIAAAAAKSPSEQADMASSMVESLAGKLKANPKNVDGWVMLMRSRMVQGEPAKASQALKEAIAANPADADRLRKEAEIMGVQ